MQKDKKVYKKREEILREDKGEFRYIKELQIERDGICIIEEKDL